MSGQNSLKQVPGLDLCAAFLAFSPRQAGGQSVGAPGAEKEFYSATTLQRRTRRSVRLHPNHGACMGDKNPKSKDKNKKQGDAQKKGEKAAHDKKQAPPSQSGKK